MRFLLIDISVSKMALTSNFVHAALQFEEFPTFVIFSTPTLRFRYAQPEILSNHDILSLLQMEYKFWEIVLITLNECPMNVESGFFVGRVYLQR